MNECVYDLIPEPQYAPEREPRHVSKFRNSSVRLPPPSYTTFPCGSAVDGSAAALFKRSGANMGKVVGSEIDPRSFLKRGNGVKHVVEPQHKEKMFTKPPIVSASDKPVMGLTTEKDFVKANAVEMANMATRGRKPEPPMPTQRSSFGKVPAYLETVKAQLNGEKQYVQALKESSEKRQVEAKEQYVRQMPEEQRLQLVSQLKERWEEKHRQFLSLPFSRDTMMQIARKEAVEKELKEIEAAMARLDKKVVYVYQDDPLYGSWAKSMAQTDAQATALRLSGK